MAENGNGQITISFKQLMLLAPAVVALAGGGGSFFQEQRLGPRADATDEAVNALALARHEIAQIRLVSTSQLEYCQSSCDQTQVRLIRMMGAMGCITPEQAEKILSDVDAAELKSDYAGNAELIAIIERNLDSGG